MPALLDDVKRLLQDLDRLSNQKPGPDARPAQRPATPSAAVKPTPAAPHVRNHVANQRASPATTPSASKPVDARKRAARRRMALLTVALVGAFVCAPLVSTFVPAKNYVIATGSMEPTIPKGSMVFAMPGEVQRGDIIVYWSPLAQLLEVHRVVDIRQEDGRTYYVARGDNNEASDSALVSPSDVRGVVHLILPYLGELWMVPRLTVIVALVLAIGTYAGIVAWDARFRPFSRLRGILAGGIIVLLVAPMAHGAINPAFAKATNLASVATTPLPLSAGTMASATITEQNQATVTTAAPKLWKEITMWGCDPANLNSNPGCIHKPAGAGYAVVAGSIIKVNAADYSPAPTFFLEVFLKAPSAGQSTSIQLYDKTGGAATGPELISTSTTLELKRSTGLTLSGNKEYQFQTKNSVANGEVHMVKLVILQTFPTATVTQVRLSAAAESTSNNLVDTGRTAIWSYDGADLDGTVNVYFEAVAQVPAGSNNGAEVRLVTTAGASVATLSITNAMTSATRVISGALALVNGQQYKVQFKDGGNGGGNRITLHMAKIVITQSTFTKTLKYVDLAWRTTVATTTFTKVGYDDRYHMDSEWGPVTAYFEATLTNSNGGQTTTARLYDYTAAAPIASSDVAAAGTSVTRQRSAAITLNAANGTYAIELKGSGVANAETRSAWIIIKQTATKTYDYALKGTNAVGTCTWSYILAQTSSSNMARITGATLQVRGDSSTQTQIIWTGGSFTQTSGTAVTVAPSNSVKVIVLTNPSSAGSSTVGAELRGTCGGVKTVQPLTFSLT